MSLPYIHADYTPAAVAAQQMATIGRARQAASSNMVIQYRGIGEGEVPGKETFLSKIPLWVWLATGGLAAGVGVGMLVFSKKGRR